MTDILPQMSVTAAEVEARLLGLADPDIAAHSRTFFKTGPGGYGEGDRFLGIRMPVLRELARKFKTVGPDLSAQLLASPFHELRMFALLHLVARYQKGNREERTIIYDLYLANTARINNWDQVDCSAPQIIGGHLDSRDRSVLDKLVASVSLWERRIAIMATFHFIRNNDFADTLRLAEILLPDREDLIHKAVGWMLREVGKRDKLAATAFLDRHCRVMPRTMLRYAIEKFPAPQRQFYLQGGPSPRQESPCPQSSSSPP